MVSWGSGLWVILSILLLFIPGHKGHDGGDTTSIEIQLPNNDGAKSTNVTSITEPPFIEQNPRNLKSKSLLRRLEIQLPNNDGANSTNVTSITETQLPNNDDANSTNVILYAGSRGGVGGTWNDRIKNALVTITGVIPPIGGIPVGKILSSLLKLFWPESEKDIWSLIKDQVEGLVDKKILEFELQERNNEIRALQRTMQMYVEAQIREKGSLMSTMIHACNELYVKLTESSNSVQFIPLVVTHSIQHLLILKERLLHGKEMYDEDNTVVWKKDLEEQISTYKDYIKDIYNKWVEWRNSRIILDVGVSTIGHPIPPFFRWEPYGNVHDELTDDKAKYFYAPILGPNDANYFRPICETVKNKLFSLRNGEMLQILVTAFYLDNFIPGNEDNPSVIPSAMSKASFGPFSDDLDGGTDKSNVYSPGDDNTRGGDVTKINVREWNMIDGFQVFYSTHSGSFYGYSGGGKLHELPVNNRRVRSIEFCYNNCNQVSVTIGFSDGTSSGRLGNRGGWRVKCVNTGFIDTYGLSNIRATDNGCAKGLYQVSVDYKAYSVRPSQIDNKAHYSLDLEKVKYASAIDTEDT